MRSPLGPAVANIFVGFYEGQLLGSRSKPPLYFRYAVDIFAIFKEESDCNVFLQKLASVFEIYFRKRARQLLTLPFLDVLVHSTALLLDFSPV